MQTNSFRYIVALDEYGSINKAAEKLFISQQGLRKTLNSLESELGFKLVKRTHKGIEFTERGLVFLKYARAVISDLEEMRSEMTSLNQADDEEEPINLIVSPYVSMSVFRKAPLTKVSHSRATVHEWNKDKIANAIEEGRSGRLYLYDWIPHTASDPTRKAQVSATRNEAQVIVLFESSIGLMSKRASTIAQQASIGIEEVENLPLACFNSRDYLQMVDLTFGGRHLDNIVFKTSSQESIESFLLNDEAAWIIDRFIFSNPFSHTDEFGFTQLKGAPSNTVGFAYMAHDPNAHAYQRLIGDMRRLFERRY